ncbi:LysR family transcriptional regulator [Caldimonas thermodepolymerans]|uniref:DNA-binding transcriptional LysR family regulator n=2 Tax=Caldimonas thermodepolymerans TaxID=215580 RepID=A0A2S5T976_9BURK|nr:LysR family transcriptional regulator [Caldimonas thermodepolymerans]QPC33438.1 LysR family transcriptional regulator [Caldimonas thermodepolymerans]RDI02810.1 DNA-binding transcriptional LysR family regulator [Caldimonas thermodepolymerans]TCP08660.1 DNA-binding transcriptional LysR family regulator [Caldimonas thermodepolymerans]
MKESLLTACRYKKIASRITLFRPGNNAVNLDPNDLLLFSRVAEAGSFTRAAARVGLPKSTVSRRISALERQLGERLLTRTTRKLSLTDFGYALLEHARQVAAEVDAAASLVLHRQAQPSGRLKVSMPAGFAGKELGRILTDFLTRYPGISIEIDLSSRRVDLIGENFDLAIRMGDMPDDATLVARRLLTHTWGLYAAPMYLALHGTPQAPEDLLQHTGLALRSRTGEPTPWNLRNGEARWTGLAPPRAVVNAPELLVEMALEGAGITAAPDAIVTRHVKEGRLVRVLPQWCLPEAPGWAVLPGRRLVPAKTRVFLEMLDRLIAEGRLGV